MSKSFLGVRSSPGKVIYGSFVVDNVHIPLVVAAGKKPGPTLCIHCAQHGQEYSGSAMIGPLLAELDLSTLAGTLLVVPLCHIPHITRSRVPDAYQRIVANWSEGELAPSVNINRRWPGKPDGDFNDHLAHRLAHGLFAEADAVLDYHSCRLCDPDFTSYQHGHEASRKLALAFGFEVIDEAPDEGHFPGQCHREVPRQIGTPAILVEMSPTAGQTNWHAIAEAKRGAINALRHMGMVAGRPVLPDVQVVFHRGGEGACMRAGQIGFAMTYRKAGSIVQKGELLAEVRSLKDFSVLERHVAPFAGGVGSAGPATHHVVLPGEELCTIQTGVEVIRNKRSKP